jgi:hypothetical protein
MLHVQQPNSKLHGSDSVKRRGKQLTKPQRLKARQQQQQQHADRGDSADDE